MDMNFNDKTDTSDTDTDYEKGRRSKWSASNLQEAIQLVPTDKMSRKKSSQKFVVRHTNLLCYSIQNHLTTTKKLGHPPF